MKRLFILIFLLNIACSKDPQYEDAYYVDCDRTETVTCNVLHYTYHISKPNDTINKWYTNRITNCGSYGWGECLPNKYGIVYKWVYNCPDCNCDTTHYWKVIYN